MEPMKERKIDDEMLVELKKVSILSRGNISSIAKAMGVGMSTIYDLMNANPEVKNAVNIGRKQLLFDCYNTASVLAMGIPLRDENGKIVGWQERPDSRLLQFFMTKLGKEEGLGDDVKVDVTSKGEKVGGSIQIEIIDSREKVELPQEEEDLLISDSEELEL